MNLKLKLCAMNEHFAAFCEENCAIEDNESSGHSVISEVAAFLSIDSYGRLAKFFENYESSLHGLPLFPLSDDDELRGYLKDAMTRPIAFGSLGRLKSFLRYHGIPYLGERFLKEFLKGGADSCGLSILDIDAFIGFGRDLGSLVRCAAASYRNEAALYALSERVSIVDLGDSSFQVFRASDSGMLTGESFVYDDFVGSADICSRLHQYAVLTALDELGRWKSFKTDRRMREGFVTSFFGGDQMPSQLRALLRESAEKISFAFDIDGGFMEVGRDYSTLLLFADRCVDAVIDAILKRRVFVCGNCEMPCISVQEVKQDEARYCSVSCRNIKRRKKADNA